MRGATAASARMKGGIGSLYVGLGGSLLGQVPYGMLSFGTYEMYKAALLKRFPVRSRTTPICVGIPSPMYVKILSMYQLYLVLLMRW